MKEITKQDFMEAIKQDKDVEFIANRIIDIFELKLSHEFTEIKNSHKAQLGASKGGLVFSICSFVNNDEVLTIVKKHFEHRGFVIDSGPATGIKLELII